MKFFILLVLATFNCFANYVSEDQVSDPKMVYRTMGKCQKTSGKKCFKWEKGYIKGSVSVQEKEFDVEDTSKPELLTQPVEFETCSGMNDCNTKVEKKVCGQSEYYARVQEDFERIYCVKSLGYPTKKETRRVLVEDIVKKNELITKTGQSEIERQQVQQIFKAIEHGKKVFALVQLMNKKKGLTKEQRKQVRQSTKPIREDLFEGYLEEARDKVQAMPESELVTAEDKQKVVDLINEFLTINN